MPSTDVHRLAWLYPPDGASILKDPHLTDQVADFYFAHAFSSVMIHHLPYSVVAYHFTRKWQRDGYRVTEYQIGDLVRQYRQEWARLWYDSGFCDEKTQYERMGAIFETWSRRPALLHRWAQRARFGGDSAAKCAQLAKSQKDHDDELKSTLLKLWESHLTQRIKDEIELLRLIEDRAVQ